jgi:threonine dehydrogenase-like Zn-dependent dehydrogenase
MDMQRLFRHNISLRGGVAPVRAYIPEMIPDVLSGKLDASAVLDREVALDGVPAGYAAMDQREAIKVMVKV